MPAEPLPSSRLGPPEDFRAVAKPTDLVYIVLNVGDGDCQALLLPEVNGVRPLVVVDVYKHLKLLALLDELKAWGLGGENYVIDLMVATHPHDDHIGGMAQLMEALDGRIREFWEPGYFHTSGAYEEMMGQVEAQKATMGYLQPSSGTSKWIGDARLTVLAPGISLRSRFDSYGIEINDSSIALKVDFPAARVLERNDDRTYVKLPTSQTLILGADAQTTSWAQVVVDFPQLGPEKTPVTDALRMARGSEPLSAQVLKVPHHGSKHGINLEVMEHMKPAISIVSCGLELGKYNFPHKVTQEVMREALEAVASKPAKKRSSDHELGIHYTGSRVDTMSGPPAGSVGLIVTPGGRRRLYRFAEERDQPVDLNRARRVL